MPVFIVPAFSSERDFSSRLTPYLLLQHGSNVMANTFVSNLDQILGISRANSAKHEKSGP